MMNLFINSSSRRGVGRCEGLFIKSCSNLPAVAKKRGVELTLKWLKVSEGWMEVALADVSASVAVVTRQSVPSFRSRLFGFEPGAS